MEMKDSVMRFEKFIQENDAKRQRAEMKAKAEHKLLQQKEHELLTLQDELSTGERDKGEN